MKSAHWNHQGLQEVCAKTQLPPGEERRQKEGKEDEERREKTVRSQPLAGFSALLSTSSAAVHILFVINHYLLRTGSVTGWEAPTQPPVSGYTTGCCLEPPIQQLYVPPAKYTGKAMQTQREKHWIAGPIPGHHEAAVTRVMTVWNNILIISTSSSSCTINSICGHFWWLPPMIIWVIRSSCICNTHYNICWWSGMENLMMLKLLGSAVLRLSFCLQRSTLLTCKKIAFSLANLAQW